MAQAGSRNGESALQVGGGAVEPASGMIESIGLPVINSRVEGLVGIEPVREIVLKVVVNSERGAHGPVSFSGRVPGHTHARLQESLGVVFHERRAADYRVGLQDPVRVKEVIGRAIVDFIPTVGHLVPQSQAYGEILSHLDFILEIHGGFI